ncbi:MAG: PaaX family transcriptional regulator C-terminal domain-containing protein [Actinomycetota bacterium]
MADLSARSVIASTLLGTVPPRLPGRVLVAFTGEFGIQPGTTRTALSRMVDRGELTHLDGGEYELAGDLLARHLRQEAGLRPATHPWDGTWELHVVPPGARSSSDRTALRGACGHLGLWERRDGVWMRPANLAPDRLPTARAIVDAQTDAYVASPAGDPAALLAELYDLAGWAGRAEDLIAELTESGPALADELADGFVLAAAALRHLVTDPLLPDELAPERWPAARLREAYATFLDGYQAGLRTFFRSVLASG